MYFNYSSSSLSDFMRTPHRVHRSNVLSRQSLRFANFSFCLSLHLFAEVAPSASPDDVGGCVVGRRWSRGRGERSWGVWLGWKGVGSDLPKLGSDLPKVGSDLPNMGSHLPKVGSDLPKLSWEQVW